MACKKHSAMLYKKVYTLLIKGYTQKKICKTLQKDKGYISRVVRRLEQAGYIICQTPQCNSKYYVATRKHFNIKKIDELYKLPSSKSQRVHGRCNIIQIQKCSFIADVNKNYSDGSEKWDKTWVSNGVDHFLYEYPFNNIGNVKFQRIVGRNSDRVKVILPRIDWHKGNGNPEDFLLDLARRCFAFFSKRFHLVLNNIDFCQRPDFALALDDVVLVDMAQKGTYHSTDDSIMIDSSAPDNIPEVESKRWDIVEGLASAPFRIRKLEERMSSIESSLVRIESFMSRMEVMFSFPNKPDTFEEVV